MSDAQQQRMKMSAAWNGRKDYERKATKMIESCDCPLAVVHASSGGPNTESSVTCAYYDADPRLLNWSPHCDAIGQIKRCPLLKRSKDRGDLKAFMDIRLAQINRDRFTIKVDRSMAWREFPA